MIMAIVSAVFLTWKKALPVDVPMATEVTDVVANIVVPLKSQSVVVADDPAPQAEPVDVTFPPAPTSRHLVEPPWR